MTARYSRSSRPRLVARVALVPLLALAGLAFAGCGAAPSPRLLAASPAHVLTPPPAVLARSLFSKDASGSLGEDDMQKILESPIDLPFPARIGVVPLGEPFDARAPVGLGTRSIASRELATALAGAPWFSHVSDISTDLPNVGGIEGLRAIAARYRVRYLVLYSQRFEDDTRLNAWAWLYPTVIGMFVAPGVTVASHGVAQADLLDVRTGTILFTAVEPIDVARTSLMVGAGRAHREAQALAAAHAAKSLGRQVVAQTNALVAWVDAPATKQRVVRLVPAPVEASGRVSAAQ